MRTIIAGLILTLALPLSAQTLVFDNVRLVDVAGDSISDPQRLGVRDGFIVAADSIDDPDRVVSAEGYLMPGLAEMHAHVPRLDSGEQVVHDTLMLWLAHGITTIRGMLGEPGHLTLRRQLADGEVPGPRLVTSGPSFNGRSVSSPNQARQMALAQAEAGYDLLKLHPGLWPEAFDAIARAADGLGIDYSGHISVAVGLDRVLDSDQGTIDHLDGYAQEMVPEDHALHGTDPGFFGSRLVAGMQTDRLGELAQRTADAGIANVPTQTLIENIAMGEIDELLARPAMQWMPDEVVGRWEERVLAMRDDYPGDAGERFVRVRRELIAALHEAGAMLLAGADTPQIMNVPGDAIHHELSIYVDAGLSPAEALATATVNVAEYLGESNRGCLEPGCVADVVLLEADPLEDIDHSRSIQGVMRAGEWFDRERLDQALDAIAERAAVSSD